MNKMTIKKIIDEWYYEDLVEVISIGEISRIKLAKRIHKYIETQTVEETKK